MVNTLMLSEYVKLAVTVPEPYADDIRDILGKAGAGKYSNHSFSSFSTKGTRRFITEEVSSLHTEQIVEIVIEEKIETVCPLEILEWVIAAIRSVHPYKHAIIEIYPLYQNGITFTT